MTNREWLINEMQNMSDEGLAECVNCCDFDVILGLCEDCTQCTVEWLKQERIEKIKLSEVERNILTYLPERYKYIARDGDDELYVYERKPQKTDVDSWDTTTSFEYESLSVFNHLFEFIKWEDKEPYEISKLLEVSED